MWEGQRPIALGRRSRIFQVGGHQVVKIYQPSFPCEEVVAEFEKTRIVARCTGIAVPQPVELLSDENLTGIVFERVDGISMMDEVMRKPWRIFSLRKLAPIQKEIHQVSVAGIVTQEEFFIPGIERSDRLAVHEKKIVKSAFMRLATHSPKLCHGDFHMDNVLVDKGRFIVIDWMDAFSGNPLLDVALTAVNSVVSTSPDHVARAFQIAYRLVSHLPLDRWYLRQYGLSYSKPRVRDALLVAAAIHLVRCKEKTCTRQHEFLMKSIPGIEAIGPEICGYK